MSEKAWIIRGDNGDLKPGFYRARLRSGEPEVFVHLDETYPVDEDGYVIGDAVYEMFIDGRQVRDFEQRFANFGLTGFPIDEAAYYASLGRAS